VKTILLLLARSVFMTFAWCGRMALAPPEPGEQDVVAGEFGETSP